MDSFRTALSTSTSLTKFTSNAQVGGPPLSPTLIAPTPEVLVIPVGSFDPEPSIITSCIFDAMAATRSSLTICSMDGSDSINKSLETDDLAPTVLAWRVICAVVTV